jgi:hypothetical protein
MLHQCVILCNNLLQIIFNCTKLHSTNQFRVGCFNTGEHMTDNEEMKKHNAAVEAMFQQIKPIVEGYDGMVALNTLLITLAECGRQTDLDPEVFKAFVVQELDRLMLINAQPRGPLS